jgi:hypothetical protein
VSDPTRRVGLPSIQEQASVLMKPSDSRRIRSSARFWALALAPCLALVCAPPALGQLRIVNYNCAQLGGNLVNFENVLSAMHDDDKPGFALPVSVFLFQEVRDEDIVPLLNLVNSAAPAGASYVLGTYTNINRDPYAGAQAMIFRSDQIVEVPAEHADIYTGAGRYADRWKLRVLLASGQPYGSAAASMYIYSMHLKSSNSAQDQADRLFGAQQIREDADALPAGSHVIYSGDFNLYTNTEPAYQHFISAAPPVGQAFDPFGTGSWAGVANAIKHTQSPCLNGCSLVGGGLDDRFDFQLHTAPFQDAEGLSYMAGTYRSFGNDGAHYNTDINAGNNTYYPGNIPLSNAIADWLHDASDHIPLMAEYRVPAVVSGTLPPSYGRVIQNAIFGVQLQVANPAEAVVVDGADELEYNAVGSLGLSGSFSDTVLALGDVSAFNFPLNTSVVGPRTGRVTLTSSSEGAENQSPVLETNGTIVRHANASFSGASDVNQLSVRSSFQTGSGVQLIPFQVHNLGYDALQALLDIDSTSGWVPPFMYVGPPPPPPSGIGAAHATLTFGVDTSNLAPGAYEASITINTSDENLPGATSAAIQVAWSVTIEPVQSCAEDITADGVVNVDDLLGVIGAWGPCQPGPPPLCPEDIIIDGVVNVDDLLAVISAWGACP